MQRLGTAPRQRPQQAGAHSPQNVCEAEDSKVSQDKGDSAEMVFAPAVQRMVRIHHYELRDRVSRRGIMVKYAERPLLGINGEAEAAVNGILLSWLAIK